jgi:hypothetical protein
MRPRPTTTSLVLDPITPTTLYAGTGGGGVFTSTDGGGTWTAMNAGLANSIGSSASTAGGLTGYTSPPAPDPTPEALLLALDPATPTTLYVGIRGNGVYRLLQMTATPQLFLGVNVTELTPASPTHTLSVTLLPGTAPTAANLYLVTLTPSTPSTPTDVYLALRLPDGSPLLLQGDGTVTPAMTPLIRNWSGAPGTWQVFQYRFSGTEPAGTYTWLAGFTSPGTTNFLGPVVSAPFSFSK